MRSTGAALALLAVAACTDDVADPNPAVIDKDIVDQGTQALSAAEIRIFLRNSTLTHQGETRDWHVYLSEDGRLGGVGISREDESRVTARGEWTVVEPDVICRQWYNEWGGGREGCARVFKYGDEYVFIERGTPEGEEPDELRRLRRPGNPEKI